MNMNMSVIRCICGLVITPQTIVSTILSLFKRLNTETDIKSKNTVYEADLVCKLLFNGRLLSIVDALEQKIYSKYIFGITNLADTERIIDDHTRIRKRILGIIIDQDDENPKFFDGTPADYALYTALTSNISYSFPSPCIAFTETGLISFVSCSENWEEITCKVPANTYVAAVERKLASSLPSFISLMYRHDMIRLIGRLLHLNKKDYYELERTVSQQSCKFEA
ncbi:unnamed protein product [Enterobius vermicularis]|uniref:ODV-E27 n=1 Tax=Enterobius vermicularis TaxID=51028 RepID=A0A0N4VGE2_ENTVE|nr:unnamed protein product [Enterobius vermicularis]